MRFSLRIYYRNLQLWRAISSWRPQGHFNDLRRGLAAIRICDCLWCAGGTRFEITPASFYLQRYQAVTRGMFNIQG